MVRSTLFRKLLVLALGFGTHVAADGAAAAACTRSIKALQGDTCASLAAVAGITVAQFLRANPSVTSCTALSPGSTYCLEGVAASEPAAPSTTTTPAPTSAPLTVSIDGTCGAGVTCKGSRFGDCCSEHGFCGSSGSYCGDGCQADLGVCGSNPDPSASPTITTPPAQGTATVTTTITVTATTTSTNIVTVTRASIVLQTQTSYILVTSTAVTTRTVVQSATAIATATATVTATATAIATTTQTVRATVLSTSTVLITSTSTSTAFRTVQTTITKTNQVDSTSVVIETLTTIKTVSVTVGNTIGCNPGFATTIWATSDRPGGGITIRPTSTGRPIVITTISQIQPRPTPYLPGSSNSCKSYDQIQSGDSCRELANRNDVSLLDFYKLNPSVSANRNLLTSLLCTPELIELLLNGLCQIDCDNLWPGYFVCVGV